MNEKKKGNRRQPVKPTLGSQRSQRFPIKVPMRYRKQAESNWSEGRTENISQSGLLFKAPEPLNPDTLLQLSFNLPVESEGASGAMVICEGRTVRTILPVASDESPSVAVKILNYMLKRIE